MKKIFLSLLASSILTSQALFGANTATQVVNMSIASTSNIVTSGNPATMAVTLSTGGTGSATDNSTTYTVTSNTGANGSLKVTGAITTGGNMPANTALTVSLASSDGTSQGAQTLSTTPVDLITRLPTLLSDTGTITYNFSVTNGWTIPAQTISRTVTLTLTSG